MNFTSKNKPRTSIAQRFFRISLIISSVLLLSACSQGNHDKMGTGENMKMGQHWFSAAQVTEGKKVFAVNCKSCHGYKAKGTFNWRKKLPDGTYPAPPLNGSAHSWHHNYQYLVGQIANGGAPIGGTMPAFKDILTEKQRTSAVAYIQSLWGDDIYKRWQMGGKHQM